MKAYRLSKGMAELFENGTTKYLSVLGEAAELTHEEHAKMKAYRHGDVVIWENGNIPKNSKKLDHCILAWGEVTGHKHQISKGMAELFENGTTKYLRVLSEAAELTHEEHATITLPKGDYEFKIQREYRPGGWDAIKD